MPAWFAFTQQSSPGQEFIIQLNQDSQIQKARDILSGKETEAIHVHGRIVKRRQPYNPRFNFYLDPDTINFFAQAIEVCDATMYYVEEHLDEACGAFLPGCHWCPWDSKLSRELTP